MEFQVCFTFAKYENDTKSSSDRSSSALRASVLFLSFPRAGTARARGVR